MQTRGWLGLILVLILLVVSGVIFRTATYREDLTLAEKAVYEAVAPLQRLVNGAMRGLRSGVEEVVALRRVREENLRLESEIAQLRSERDALLEAGRQNATLRSLMDITKEAAEEVAVAEVIARSPSNWLGSLTINKGRKHGVEPGMAVVAAEGAVGKIRYATERTAEVVLITDARSSVGGRLRDQGHLVLVEGTGDPTEEWATVRLLTWEASIQPGDVVVASELSLIFPKGLPIGVVEAVDDPESSGLIPTGKLRPFVDLARLEWVIVLREQSVETPWWEEAP